MSTLNKYFFLLICFLFATLAYAQPGPDGGLPSEEVKVIQDFEARLADSEKLVLMPELPPAEDATKNLNYKIPVKSLQMEYLAPKLRPLAMKAKKEEKGYKGYLKAGYGLPRASLGDFSYHFIDSEQFILGINLHHQAANNTKLEHQRFMDNRGEINGTYYLENGLAVGGNFGIDNRQLHFYGYDHTEQIYERSQIRQRFNKVYGQANVFNGERNYGDINYKGIIDIYHLTDRYTAKETGVNIHLSGTKWFNEKHPFTLDVIADFTNPNNLLTNSINNYYIKPNFTWHGDRFRFKAGVNFAFDDRKLESSNNRSGGTHIFPDAELAVNILGNKLAAYLGAGGDLEKNTMLSLSEYNPFIATQDELLLRNSRHYHFYGGVKGNLTLLDYQIEGGYKPTDDLALFLNNEAPLDTTRFAVLYDTVDIYNLTGSLTATPIKNLVATITLGQNYYRPKNEEKAWHLPSFSMNFSARYTTLSDKLVVKGELFFENGVPFRDNQTQEVDHLNNLYDLNLGAEYRVFRNVGVFLDVNNVLNNKRQRWNRYPMFGTNLVGGVTARF
ncbi:MAG: hypothetical protein AB8F74_12540 [Saprospiraceae bacterium]